MAIGRKLKEYLADARVEYDLVDHPRTEGSSQTAHAAHIPGDRLAKGVVLHHGDEYVVAVLPSTNLVDFSVLQETLGGSIELASESEIDDLFQDCMRGAIPAAATAYDLKTVVDEALDDQPEIWFEGGDHRTLVHVAQKDFRRLMMDAQHAQFSR